MTYQRFFSMGGVFCNADDLKLLILCHLISIRLLGTSTRYSTFKCTAMTLGRMSHPISFDYNINGDAITTSVVIKDSGITFDRRITFMSTLPLLPRSHSEGYVLDCEMLETSRVSARRTELESSSCAWNQHEVTYAFLLEKVQKAFLRHLYKHTYFRMSRIQLPQY